MAAAELGPVRWRLRLARTLAWALLLGGWVGLGSLAQALAPGPFSGFALLAGWLLALGLFAELIGRLRLPGWMLRTLLIGAALMAARALYSVRHGGGAFELLPALMAWAIIVALASSTVRSCRLLAWQRPGPPVAAAAAGALLAWLWVGDITDTLSLGPRLMFGALLASALLALLLPPRSATPRGCRAGLFDCSLPGGSPGDWRRPARWPVLVASLVMLPMMCTLPLMVTLCRSELVSPQLVLGVHFAAMFVPALWLVWRPAPASAAAPACAVLLALGALAVLAAPGAWAWWGLALAHGSAWSIAWWAQLDDRVERAAAAPARPHGPATPAAHGSPLRGAALNAVFALALGAGLATVGLPALTGWHVTLGLAGALAALAALARVLPDPHPR